MRTKQLLSFILIFSISILFGQELYVKEYGNSKNPPILFLHGGPDFNSINFEVTTAQKLADYGYFVIVYDRSGEGRSGDVQAHYTFTESTNDIENILKKYQLSKINLVAHSFGGAVATKFAEKNPSKITSITFVSAPFSYQNILKGTLAAVKKIYTDNNDTTNLNYIKMIENMDTKSLEYSSYILMHAMGNRFYTPKKIATEAQSLYTLLASNKDFVEYSKKIDYNSTMGYWKNESYTSLDLGNLISQLDKKIRLYGIYGEEDGIIPQSEIDYIKKTISDKNVIVLKDCSHNVFIDQQDLFINNLKNWIK